MNRYPRVLNRYKDKLTPGCVYVGRPTKYGNPFSYRDDTSAQFKVQTREESVQKYREWLLNQPELLEQAKKELRGKDLVCTCSPLLCHADVLISLVNEGLMIRAPWTPQLDGVDHLNAYSRAKTTLGQQLSHLAPIPFVHPEHGYFVSLESFWYWNKTDRKHDFLKNLRGFEAKQEGRKLEVVKRPTFMKEVEECIRLKITQHDQLLYTFKRSTLPITHYYVIGQGTDQKAIYTKTSLWFEYYYNKLRDRLNGLINDKDLKVIVAGSRTIQDYDLVVKVIEDSGFNIGEIVSGVANGPDRLGLRYANERFIPVKEFPAHWSLWGKRAGMIRNAEMAEYADVLIALIENNSTGTRNMIQTMERLGKATYVVEID